MKIIIKHVLIGVFFSFKIYYNQVFQRHNNYRIFRLQILV